MSQGQGQEVDKPERLSDIYVCTYMHTHAHQQTHSSEVTGLHQKSNWKFI